MGIGYLDFGHLCILKEPHDYKEEMETMAYVRVADDSERFGIKLIDEQGIIKQFKTIERLFSEADEIINCGDAGQEGEVIQRWVLQQTKCKKPVKRLWISSLTEEAIKEALSIYAEVKII